MFSAPTTPAKVTSFQWPLETNSPDVVSWANSDCLKYDMAPQNNPNSWTRNPIIRKELEELGRKKSDLSKLLVRSISKKPPPICDITHIRAINERFKKQIESTIDYKNRNEVADRIIENKDTYSQMSLKSGYSVKKLRIIAHRRIRYGKNFDNPGRSRVIDLVSENYMIKHFDYINDLEQLKSPECKKSIRKIFKSEVIATHKRRYPQSVETIKNPSNTTIEKYYKLLYDRLYNEITKSNSK